MTSSVRERKRRSVGDEVAMTAEHMTSAGHAPTVIRAKRDLYHRRWITAGNLKNFIVIASHGTFAIAHVCHVDISKIYYWIRCLMHAALVGHMFHFFRHHTVSMWTITCDYCRWRYSGQIVST